MIPGFYYFLRKITLSKPISLVFFGGEGLFGGGLFFYFFFCLSLLD